MKTFTREDIMNVVEILQNEAKELEDSANNDWTVLAQATGLEQAVDIICEMLLMD